MQDPEYVFGRSVDAVTVGGLHWYIEDRSSGIPWRRIAGLRDINIHQHMGVDTEAVCNVIEENLSELKQAVTDIQSEINE